MKLSKKKKKKKINKIVQRCEECIHDIVWTDGEMINGAFYLDNYYVFPSGLERGDALAMTIKFRDFVFQFDMPVSPATSDFCWSSFKVWQCWPG